MNKEIKSVDDSFFIMKWGKFITLIISIVVATNFITGFMISSEFADAQARHHDEEVEKEKTYNEARDKRRLARVEKDSKNYVDKKILENEIKVLKKEIASFKKEH